MRTSLSRKPLRSIPISRSATGSGELYAKTKGKSFGALLQFRKALELYDPKSHDILAEIMNAAIFDMRCGSIGPSPPAPPWSGLFITIQRVRSFARHSTSCLLPSLVYPNVLSARNMYSSLLFRIVPLPGALLPSQPRPRFSDVAAAFDKLTSEDAEAMPPPGSTWESFGHGRAIMIGRSSTSATWNGSDEAKIAEAGALIEVLRCGEGMESDYIEHRVFFQLQQGKPVIALLEEWGRHGPVDRG